MNYDTVIIGAGLAGLTTACHLAQAKQKVALMSTGIGSLVLASGCIDVLGFQPAASQQPVINPAKQLGAFLTEQPEHPYHHLGQAKIEASLGAFLELVEGYEGSFDKNWLLPSTAGAVHPTCLAPKALAQGELSQGGSMLIVGFKELRDFYPSLISHNLNAQNLGVQSEAITIDAPPPLRGRMNITPIELAHAFEQAEFRQQIVTEIRDKVKNCNRVGFPAVLGLQQHATVLADLERQLGRTVFEISTLPPSVPGRRLFEQLRHYFLQHGGRLTIGSKVVDGTIESGRVSQIRIETASRLQAIKAQNYILATGSIFGGGLQTDNEGRVWEAVFNLPIEHETNRHAWFDKGFLAPQGQPVARYGVQVNDRFNPVNSQTEPLATNLHAVGGLLANSVWTQGRTGDGVAVATAWRVRELLG